MVDQEKLKKKERKSKCETKKERAKTNQQDTAPESFLPTHTYIITSSIFTARVGLERLCQSFQAIYEMAPCHKTP